MDDPTSMHSLRTLDEHLARAWPAIERKRIGDFELRFGGGYGRRSNSARRVRSEASASAIDPALVDRIETMYREAALRPTFYVAHAFSDDALAALLAARGYESSEDFGVFVGEVDAILARAARPSSPVRLASPDARAMARALTGVEAGKSGEEDRLAALFAHAELPMRLATVIDRPDHGTETIVAAAIAVLDGDLCSVHELVTASSQRRRGLASALVCALVDAARREGGKRACAQIAEANVASETLFRGLAFERVYGYRYMVAPPPR